MNVAAPGVIGVTTLDAALTERWDSFVEACPEATFFHLSGWKQVIEDSFGHRCEYLCAKFGDTVCGVLPLVHLKSWIFGNSLISNAFCVYGGTAADENSIRRLLDERAENRALALGVGYLEYRGREPSHPDWHCNSDLYVSFRKEIEPDPEKNLLAIPRKQRAMVRKGIKNDLKSEIDDDVERFYRLYSTSVRNLGTPVFSKKYFHNLKKVFADKCEILTVTHGGRPVSSVMSFLFRDEIHPYYGGGSADARPLAANDFMYWEVMRRAAENGCRVFDFGRSKRGTGSYAFKTHWGFEPVPLHYEYKLLTAEEMPDINPLNPKYRTFIALWKRLPLPVANLLGPHLARHFG